MTSLFRPPPLTHRQRNVFGMVAVASVFAAYSSSILPLALPQIQDGLSIADAQLSGVAAIVRLGSLAAFPFTLLADKIGRKRLMLVSLVVMTALTGLSAFAPDVNAFAVLQLIRQMFSTTVVLLAGVMIVEEFPAEHRGWGFGAFMLLMAGGAGIALALFGLIDSLPFGWRAMYAIGSLAFLFIPTIGRALPETQRFVRQQERGSSDLPLVAPVIGLARAYPWRIIALGAVVFLGAVAEAPAAFFLPSYLQEEHGWQPSTLTFALFTSGGLGLIGVLLIGALSDRVGRKRLAVMFLVVAPMVAAGFYNASGAILPVLLALTALTSQGVTVSINPLGAELFPTSYRSTATGARTIMSTLGGVLGLALHGVLVTPLDSQWTAITVLLAVALVAPLIAVWLPETNRRNLEDIAPER